jgi:hypothetical protein
MGGATLAPGGVIAARYNDVWVLTYANGVGGTPAWTQLSPVGTPPSARLNHRTVYDPASNRLIVFGGSDATGTLNEVWVLTHANGLGGTPTWIQLSPPGPPGRRFGFVAGYNANYNAMVVAMGRTDTPSFALYNDAWVLRDANGSISLSDAHLWLGLKNSDDQGTRFDIRVELLKNGSSVASGLDRCVTGVTRNPASALEAVVGWDAFSPVTVETGDVLALRVSTRIGTNPDDTKCSGHNSALGLRLYYDATSRDSAFDVTAPPAANADLHLRSDGNACTTVQSTGVTALSLNQTASSATAAKCRDSAGVSFAGGNPWKEIGTWSAPPQA